MDRTWIGGSFSQHETEPAHVRTFDLLRRSRELEQMAAVYCRQAVTTSRAFKCYTDSRASEEINRDRGLVLCDEIAWHAILVLNGKEE